MKTFEIGDRVRNIKTNVIGDVYDKVFSFKQQRFCYAVYANELSTYFYAFEDDIEPLEKEPDNEIEKIYQKLADLLNKNFTKEEFEAAFEKIDVQLLMKCFRKKREESR